MGTIQIETIPQQVSIDLKNTAILFLILLSSIVAIFLLGKCYRLFQGIVQHRRTCRIPATLIAGIHEFDGNITVAGLGGVRFEPINQTTIKRLKDLLGSKVFHDFDLIIRTKRIPVFVDGVHGIFSPLYYFDDISKSQLNSILSLSTVKQNIAPSIGHKTSRSKWRTEIRKRRLAINKVKQARELAIN